MKFLNSSGIPIPFLCPGTWNGTVLLFTYFISESKIGVLFWSSLYKVLNHPFKISILNGYNNTNYNFYNNIEENFYKLKKLYKKYLKVW